MACIIYRTTSTGRQYAYSSESYWDKEKQQPRCRRKYLGWVDPVTGEIHRGRSSNSKKQARIKEEENQKIAQLKAELEEKNQAILSLQAEIRRLRSRVNKLSALCKKVSDMTQKAAMDEA